MSIDAQRRALHDTAQQRALVVVDEFVDAVESGKDDDRPGFQSLIAAMKSPARAWSTILVLDTSRVARRRLIAMMFEADCTKRGVRLVYRNLPESDQATDMVLRSVMQAFDEYHSLVSRAKGLAGMAENVRQGWRAGGRAPRGYRLESVPTGAIRDGEPVTKSRLVLDESLAPVVQAYLQLRADGMPRAQAAARSGVPWPVASMHATDWQALTYAGHTAWGIEADTQDGQKRRPRSEWMVQRGTHQALIDDAQAEAILAQVERGAHGRRNRESPLLLSGLVVDADGRAWHSDGCGSYRLGKGRKVGAARLEGAVLAQLGADLTSLDTVRTIQQALRARAAGPGVDGRTITGMEKRAATLASTISRTVDLAARMDDPAPVLRRVADLEAQRARLLADADRLRAQQAQRDAAATFTDGQIRLLLGKMLDELQDGAGDRVTKAKLALAELIERIELDPTTMTARVHYALRAGDTLATPREDQLSPVRWVSSVIHVTTRRRAA